MFDFIKKRVDGAMEHVGGIALEFGRAIYNTMEAMAAMGTSPRKERQTPLFHKCSIDPRAALGPLAYVKLIHSSELANFSRFPRFQDFPGIFYHEYYHRRHGLDETATKIEASLRLEEQLREIEHDREIKYEWRSVTVPGHLFKSHVEVDVEPARLSQARLIPNEGEIRGGKLIVAARMRERTVGMALAAPSRVVNEEKITRLKAEIAAKPPEHRDFSDEMRRSLAPVLFVSHRWESSDHPDPHGEQLKRLRELKDCYIIYDYTSFPQMPRTEAEEASFQAILNHMDILLDKVVILKSSDHLDRGWLIFEYLVSAINEAIVCDEVSHADFAELHDWCSTPAPIPHNLIRNAYESMQSDYINEKIISLVSKLAALYKTSHFSFVADQTTVTNKLVGHLKNKLPPKKEYMQYLGECKNVPWTEEEIRSLFDGDPRKEAYTGNSLKRHETKVPNTLRAAFEKNYMINRMSDVDVLDDWFHKRTRI